MILFFGVPAVLTGKDGGGNGVSEDGPARYSSSSSFTTFGTWKSLSSTNSFRL